MWHYKIYPKLYQHKNFKILTKKYKSLKTDHKRKHCEKAALVMDLSEDRNTGRVLPLETKSQWQDSKATAELDNWMNTQK